MRERRWTRSPCADAEPAPATSRACSANGTIGVQATRMAGLRRRDAARPHLAGARRGWTAVPPRSELPDQALRPRADGSRVVAQGVGAVQQPVVERLLPERLAEPAGEAVAVGEPELAEVRVEEGDVLADERAHAVGVVAAVDPDHAVGAVAHPH